MEYGIIVVKYFGKEIYVMQICTTHLLTTKEYKKYQSLIPHLDKSWWLSDNDEFYQSYVDASGEVRMCMPTLQMYVRPAFYVINCRANPGDKVSMFAYSWTVLDVYDEFSLVLCDSVVTFRHSNKSCGVPFEKTQLYQWLETWVKRRDSITSDAGFKKRRKISDCGMAISSNKFLMEWFVPTVMLFALTFGCLISVASYMYLELPLTCAYLSDIACYFVGVLILIYGVWVICSPHKDTALRCILCGLGPIAVQLLFAGSFTLAAFVIKLAMLVFAYINIVYLRSIKYYS
jgi:hypothetical protein